MRQAAKKLVTAIFVNDRLGNYGTEFGHSLTKPGRHTPPMKRHDRRARLAAHRHASAEKFLIFDMRQAYRFTNIMETSS